MLKQILLNTGYFVDNSYLDEYIELIQKPFSFSGYAEKHHVIPAVVYSVKYSIDDNREARKKANADPNNFLIDLLFKDHCRAHWLLYNCTLNEVKACNARAYIFMTGKKIVQLEELSAEEYDEIQLHRDQVMEEDDYYWTIEEKQLLSKYYAKASFEELIDNRFFKKAYKKDSLDTYHLNETYTKQTLADDWQLVGAEERLEGDGAEFYTLAPTALSFRSTAPLNELQEIQINGVTVDPSNYTLEEGSTIVTFPIDYLKTLNVGSYEVAVASDSKTVKGDFTVAAPELNEHGFYYNQPYTAYISVLGSKYAFFFLEGGTMDLIRLVDNYVEACSYAVSENIISVSTSIGEMHAIISGDGTEVHCQEFATTAILGDTSVAADDDYIYSYKEELGGYEIIAIDKTKPEYGAIKTGINGIDTVKIAEEAFASGYNQIIAAPIIPNTVKIIGRRAFNLCEKLKSIVIPSSVTSIEDGVFRYCKDLTDVQFEGTVAQWGLIELSNNWAGHNEPLGAIPATHVQCSDGRVAL